MPMRFGITCRSPRRHADITLRRVVEHLENRGMEFWISREAAEILGTDNGRIKPLEDMKDGRVFFI